MSAFLIQQQQIAANTADEHRKRAEDLTAAQYRDNNGQLQRRVASNTVGAPDTWVAANNADRREHQARQTQQGIAGAVTTAQQQAQDALGRQALQAGVVGVPGAQQATAQQAATPAGVTGPQLQSQSMQAAQMGAVPQAIAERAASQGFQAAQVGGPQSVQAAQIANDQEQLRSAQMGLVGALQDQSTGVGGGELAREMLRDSRAANRADAASMAASARGSVNPALLARQAANQVATANQADQRSALLAGLQQRGQSQSQLANVIGGARGQDISVAGQQAQLQQQASLAGMDAQQQQALMQAQLRQGASQFGAGAANQASLQNAAMGTQVAQGNQQASLQAALANQQAQQQANQLNMQGGNDMAALQAQLGMQGQLANQHAGLATALQNAQLGTQAGQFNAQQANQMGLAGAQLGAQQNQFNAGAAIQQQQYNDQFAAQQQQQAVQNQLAGMGLTNQMSAQDAALLQAMQQNTLSQMGMAYGLVGQQQALAAQEQMADDSRWWNLAGSGLGATGLGLAALSDATQKTNIESADSEIDGFLGALKAHSYEYKDPSLQGAAPGQRYGIMAQDVAKSEVGRSFVFEDKDGMKLDTVQGFGPVLASLGRLQRRSDELETKLRELKARRKKGN